MHFIFAVGRKLLHLDFAIGSSSPVSQQVPSNKPYVDTLRNMLRAMYRASAEENVKKFYSSKEQTEHECTGPSFLNIHQQDPSPIWILHGNNPEQ